MCRIDETLITRDGAEAFKLWENVGKSTRVGMYLLVGVGDGAPDWGAGLSLRAEF